jgi:hypothetical protein
MSFLRLKDLPGGLAVDFVDVPSPATDALGHVDFPATPVAAGLDRTVAHSVRLAIDFVAGEDNDVVSVFVDDQLRFTGTTWENYYRHDVEAASLSNVVPVVDQMLLRVNTPGPAALQAHGFLIDDVNLRSSASAAAGAAGGVSVIPGATGATGVTGPTGATGALPRATVVCSGQTVRVLRAPNRHGERLLSARATLRGRALKVNGRRISVDLRARTAGSYRVQITSRYRKGGATATRTVRSTRTLTVRCA